MSLSWDDKVHHPSHYTMGPVEVIDIIEQIIEGYPSVMGWSIGQAIKYLARAPHKGDLSGDLQKGLWYLNRAISKLDDKPT
jgi:hypothetical protein